MHGLLCIDKAAGPSSHRVVQQVRRALSTKRVGHAGTLDPPATGLLVVLLGEATKLARFFAASDKRYRTSIRLGFTTDTLDAAGQITARAPLPKRLDRAVLDSTLQGLAGTVEQRVPGVSAVQVRGKRLYKLDVHTREAMAPTRPVQLAEVKLLSCADDRLDLELRCSKGFYVRAFAKDLAEALGTVGHVSALRRLASGKLGVEQAASPELLAAALAGDLAAREALARCVLPIADACAAWPTLRLTATETARIRQGQALSLAACEARICNIPSVWSPPDNDATRVDASTRPPLLLLDPQNQAVAVAEVRGTGIRVLRGLRMQEDHP